MGSDKDKYGNKYKKENYDRLNLLLPKGGKQILSEIANANGTSINAIIIQALEDQYYIKLKGAEIKKL